MYNLTVDRKNFSCRAVTIKIAVFVYLVETYLAEVSMSTQNQNPMTLPVGAHLRDNEDALFLLTQCSNDTDEVKLEIVTVCLLLGLWSIFLS